MSKLYCIDDDGFMERCDGNEDDGWDFDSLSFTFGEAAARIMTEEADSVAEIPRPTPITNQQTNPLI